MLGYLKTLKTGFLGSHGPRKFPASVTCCFHCHNFHHQTKIQDAARLMFQAQGSENAAQKAQCGEFQEQGAWDDLSRSPLLPVSYRLTTSQPSSPGTEGSAAGGRAGAWGSWAGAGAGAYRPRRCGRPRASSQALVPPLCERRP